MITPRHTMSRIIKKYPNRRLYDTAISSYITLSDIRQLVLEGHEFQVVDAKSGDDLTRTILLQIISEQEESGSPLFTSEVLTQFIRFYGRNVENVFSNYLERSMHFFLEQQQSIQDQMQGVFKDNPMETFTEMAEKNLEIWKSFQNSFFSGMGGSQPPRPRDEKEKDKGNS